MTVLFSLEIIAYMESLIWQVSKLASEAKRERNALADEVSKISNYGIAV